MAEAWGRRGLWGLAAGVLLVAAPVGAETHAAVPTFGVDVEVVSLSLAVTDSQGRPVPDVTAQDVAVFEDGHRQPICLFTREEWPITLVVLIDSSDSMNLVLPVAKAAARRLLGVLGPGDRAEVAQFSRRLTVRQDFTSDRQALDAAVDAIAVDGETSLYDALYISLKDLIARRRSGELERRALVVLSDGNDTASMITDDQVLDLARQAEVSVYAIGLHEAPQFDGPDPDPLPTYFLTTLTRETGGRAFFPSALGDLEGTYARIAEDLRTLYGVAYVSSNPARDGSWRRIQIRTLRPNLLVRHRAGYYAPGAARVAHGRP
jgi:Ca-activated chloride channel family protein